MKLVNLKAVAKPKKRKIKRKNDATFEASQNLSIVNFDWVDHDNGRSPVKTRKSVRAYRYTEPIPVENLAELGSDMDDVDENLHNMALDIKLKDVDVVFST
jgi:hypothetical protein